MSKPMKEPDKAKTKPKKITAKGGHRERVVAALEGNLENAAQSLQERDIPK